MKTDELLESGDALKDFSKILLLMKHGKLSRERATELADRLQKTQFYVGGQMNRKPANLRWVEDKLTGTLRFVSADMPGSWRSGNAAVGRGKVIDTLGEYGFKVARFRHSAAERKTNHSQNGPHIFFWGEGTPPMKPENLEKIWGTDEATAALTRRVQASLEKKKVQESNDGDLKELTKILKFRTTGSRLSLDQAKKVHEYLIRSGYRFHEFETEGKKYFKIVTLSYRNKDWRTTKGRDERLKVANDLRSYGFKVGAHSGHVKNDTDRNTLDWMSRGSDQHVVFW